MCTMCAMTQTFDPLRHDGIDQEFAQITEGADALAWVTTQYTMAVDDSFQGTIGTGGDLDWIEISLVAGTSYEISLEGAPTDAGTLLDPFLDLYDSTGTLLTDDDDGGVETNALINLTASTTGTYYISASAFSNIQTGSYTLTVTEAQAGSGGGAPGGAGTLDQMADYLTDGYWHDRSAERRVFDTTSDNIITVDIDALTGGGRQLARWAFEAWEMVIDVDFQEVSSGADIEFDDDDDGAYAETTTLNGNITSAMVNISQTDWLNRYGLTIDSYSFSTYVHEIGHAIGLGHQGNYNGNATYGNDETFANDSWQLSVMSYFSQTDNTTVAASEAEVISAMMVDIIAAQNLYGAAGSGSATDGATIWGQGTNLGGYWGDFFNEIADGTNSSTYDGEAVTFTIFDTGGTDIVDLGFSDTDDRIDLRAEQFSDVGGLIGNVGIARGTVLEHLRAGSGNDDVTGNDADNILVSGLGSDTLDGGAGDDMLVGGLGADSLTGGAGDDVFAFNLLTNGSGDRITDYSAGRFNAQTRAYSGDLLYLEGASFGISSQDGDLVVGGIRLEGAGNGNLAYTNLQTPGLISDLESGNFEVNPSYLTQITVLDRGTEETFDWERVFVLSDNGATHLHQISYDSGLYLQTSYDALMANTWDTIAEYRNDVGQTYDKRVTYDDSTQIRTLTDVEADDTWETVLEYRDAASELYDKRFNYDDGSQQRTVFDTDGSETWATVQEFRDAAEVLYDKRTNYDDDSQLRLIFDTASASWESIEEYRDPSDALYDKRTNYDDGTQVRLIFDSAGNQSWDSITELRDANDDLFKKNVNFDDGRYQIVLYDVDNSESWNSYVRTFDADDNLLSGIFT